MGNIDLKSHIYDMLFFFSCNGMMLFWFYSTTIGDWPTLFKMFYIFPNVSKKKTLSHSFPKYLQSLLDTCYFKRKNLTRTYFKEILKEGLLSRDLTHNA